MSREPNRPPDGPRRRRPYRRPTVRSEKILELHLIGDCAKTPAQGGDCNDPSPQTS